ncbi:MAG: AI-2E family transporter [Candidatus Midichloria sp.]|nr:MAG: AI-2E family transporter [Candidatus Midichloria sp.]
MILLIILSFIGLTYLALYLSYSIIAPFLAAICCAYALSPFMEWMIKTFKLKDGLASFLTVTLFLSFIILILSILGPLMYYQIYHLISQITSNQPAINAKFLSFITKLNTLSPQFQNQLDNVSSQLIDTVKVLLKGIIRSGSIAANALSFIIITPFVTFYLLKDSRAIKQTIYSVIPIKYQKEVKELLGSMQNVLIGFFRGQLAVCSILVVYYSFAFSLINLNYWLGLGVLFGTLIFIPYLGSLTATVLCLLIAISQFGFDYHLVGLIILLLLGQLLEGMFLTPKFVGTNVGLHPVWIIFSLIVGWNLAGFFGVIISLPFAATLGVIFKFCLRKYRNSRFYNLN